MAKSAELLPNLMILKPSKIIGNNTIECMQSGVYYSTVSSINYYFDFFKKENPEAKLVLCGGYAEVVKSEIPNALYEPTLTARGMKKLMDEIN